MISQRQSCHPRRSYDLTGTDMIALFDIDRSAVPIEAIKPQTMIYDRHISIDSVVGGSDDNSIIRCYDRSHLVACQIVTKMV